MVFLRNDSGLVLTDRCFKAAAVCLTGGGRSEELGTYLILEKDGQCEWCIESKITHCMDCLAFSCEANWLCSFARASSAPAVSSLAFCIASLWLSRPAKVRSVWDSVGQS